MSGPEADASAGGVTTVSGGRTGGVSTLGGVVTRDDSLGPDSPAELIAFTV